jgi:DNA-binding HxlR family transcriptional regulator
MPSAEKRRDTGCPVAYALDTFGDRWSLLIVRDIIMLGSKTYSDFISANEAVSTNILADRLKFLEAEGIISKNRDPANRRSFIYDLTKKGCDITPLILDMILWGAKYDSNSKAPAHIIKRIKEDRESFLNEIRSRFPDA